MFINGKSYKAASLKEILSALKELPSGFTDRTAHRTDDTCYQQSTAYELANKGSEYFATWSKTKSPLLLSQASDCYNQALKSAREANNKLILAITCSRYAPLSAIVEGNLNASIRFLTDAMVLAKDYGAKDFASQYAGELHEIIYQKVKYGFDNDIPPVHLDPWIENLRKIRQSAAKLFRNQRGEPVDHDAYRVEQGEVGFSNKQRIGTDLLVQCISPIIQNPKTKMTAFPHIDHGVDINSLDGVLEKLGHDHASEPLVVRLAGGNIDASVSVQAHTEFFRLYAGKNISQLLSYLQGKNVHIISSDIMQADQPCVMVVDPQTFDLFEHVPGKSNPDFFLAQGRAMLSAPGKPLHMAFDLSQSTTRTPVLLNTQLAETMKILAEMRIDAMYNTFAQEGEFAGSLVAERVESAECLADEYVRVVNTALRYLAERIKELEDQGIGFEQEFVQSLIDTISRRSIYVGQDSDTANQNLFNFIRHDLIKIKKEKGNIIGVVDWQGLITDNFISNPVMNETPRFDLP